MEVYIELTYLTNYLIILVALEMMAILISKEMSYLMVIKHSFYLSGVILLLYLASYSWLIILIWAVVFLCLYQRQIFLYSPLSLQEDERLWKDCPVRDQMRILSYLQPNLQRL
mgnify:CR=1 FL=1